MHFERKREPMYPSTCISGWGLRDRKEGETEERMLSVKLERQTSDPVTFVGYCRSLKVF